LWPAEENRDVNTNDFNFKIQLKIQNSKFKIEKSEIERAVLIAAANALARK
jgi:hypothetical protein